MAKHFSYDQDKVKELRMKVISLTLDALNDDPSVKKWSAYKKELVSKISPRVLPVLNAGRSDDEPVIIQIAKEIAVQNDIIDTITSNNSEGHNKV